MPPGADWAGSKSESLRPNMMPPEMLPPNMTLAPGVLPPSMMLPPGVQALDWAASLPPEVLALVFAKLPSKGDRLAFLAACRAWRTGCGAALASLALPWPIQDSPSGPFLSPVRMRKSGSANQGEQAWASTGAKAGPAKRPNSNSSSTTSSSDNAPRATPTRSSSSSSSAPRATPTRSSSSLSVRWLGSALRLFPSLTALELSVPVPPDALGPLALLPALRRLCLTLRPPPFSTAEGPVPAPSPHAAAGAGTVPSPAHAHGLSHIHAGEDKYAGAFLALLSGCPRLLHLSLGMRACRWEPWPLLPAPLLRQLALSLPGLESLHLLSPLFSSHSLAPLLPLQHLSSLTLPLDLPQQHTPPSAAASLPQSPGVSPLTVPPLPRLEQLLLQPYDQPLRGGGASSSSSSWHTRRRADPHAMQNELPPVLSALTSLRSLRVAGYARSPLQRAEFVSNALSTIAPDLGALQRLTHLELCFLRELEALPPALCSLPALASLVLRECPCLLELPEELGQLAGSLRQLELHSLGVHSLPDSLCQLSGLSSLALGHLHWLERLPPDLDALAALERLSLVSCKRVRELPPSMALLPRLGSLSLLFNQLPLAPALLPSLGHSLRCLALSLRCQADLEAVGPALPLLARLQELHLVLSDDAPAAALPGGAITAVLPCSGSAPGLLRLKVEDLRSVSYAGAVFPLEGLLEGDDDEDADVAERDGDVAEREGCRMAHARLLHFAHGPYPLLPGLRQLQVKCAWLHFSAACFPELQELDLVLVLPCPPLDPGRSRQGQAEGAAWEGAPDEECSRGGGSRASSAHAHSDMVGVLGHGGHGHGHGLASLVAEVLACPKLRALSLFTPDAPNALTATPGQQGCMGHTFQQALLGGPHRVAPSAGLTSFLLNGMDMMPCFG